MYIEQYGEYAYWCDGVKGWKVIMICVQVDFVYISLVTMKKASLPWSKLLIQHFSFALG